MTVSVVNEKAPDPTSPLEEKLLFLQSNMVSFVNQYQLPLIECSLVISKYLRILTESLIRKAKNLDEELPETITESKEIGGVDVSPIISDFPLENLIANVDEERMDIFDTIIRVCINSKEQAFAPAIGVLREWEELIRKQLAQSTSPGHLFSPLSVPDGF